MMLRRAALLLFLCAGCDQPVEAPLDAVVPDLIGFDQAQPAALACDDTMIGDAGVPGTWANVELIIDGNCSMGQCHLPVSTFPAVDMTHGHAYANIVNKLAPDPANQCGGFIVTPGHPEQSYVMVKLTKGLGMQCNPQGSIMPVGEPFSVPLANCQIDIFRRWILAGAPP